MWRPTCFTCRASDGKTVTLYKDRYDNHILMEHPELIRLYDYPSQQIEHAVVNGRVSHGQGKAIIYRGPAVQANPPAGAQQICVVALPEKDGKGWWVTTAYSDLVF